jgi:hypothetical protein
MWFSGKSPKALVAKDKTWKAFYAKFSRYAEVSEWTEEEFSDQLCWCLDGKASEYYALLVERWYMWFSGKSPKALVATDKTRSAQFSRSSSGIWCALLNCTCAVL